MVIVVAACWGVIEVVTQVAIQYGIFNPGMVEIAASSLAGYILSRFLSVFGMAMSCVGVVIIVGIILAIWEGLKGAADSIYSKIERWIK